MDIALKVADRVRQTFVKGNWPFRQEDIIRRLTIRPGQALPPPGPALNDRLERERQSVLTFLRDEGYLDAQVRLELQRRGPPPAPVNLFVHINEGPGYPLGDIQVTGNKALGSDAIIGQMRHYRWYAPWIPEPLKLRVLRLDIAKLQERYRDLGYAGARLSTDYDPDRSADHTTHQLRLRVSVLERKRVDVSFQGHQRLDEGDLKDVLTIFERGSYDSIETETSAAAIAQLYRSKGHPFVRVTWSADGSDPEVQRIRFTIVEGPRLRVREVSFAGNKAFSGGRLSDVVTVKTFPPLGALGIGEGGYASFRQLELDVDRLVAFHVASGYPDARARVEIGPRARTLAGPGHGERERSRLAAGRLPACPLPGGGRGPGGRRPGSLPVRSGRDPALPGRVPDRGAGQQGGGALPARGRAQRRRAAATPAGRRQLPGRDGRVAGHPQGPGGRSAVEGPAGGAAAGGAAVRPGQLPDARTHHPQLDAAAAGQAGHHHRLRTQPAQPGADPAVQQRQPTELPPRATGRRHLPDAGRGGGAPRPLGGGAGRCRRLDRAARTGRHLPARLRHRRLRAPQPAGPGLAVHLPGRIRQPEDRGQRPVHGPALPGHAVPPAADRLLQPGDDRPAGRHPPGLGHHRLRPRAVPRPRRLADLRLAADHPHRVPAARGGPRRGAGDGEHPHHRGQPALRRRVAAPGQSPGADPRPEAAGGGGAGHPGAVTPGGRGLVRQDHLARADGRAARPTGWGCGTACATTTGSRWPGRPCCPRSSASSPGETRPSGGSIWTAPGWRR